MILNFRNAYNDMEKSRLFEILIFSILFFGTYVIKKQEYKQKTIFFFLYSGFFISESLEFIPSVSFGFVLITVHYPVHRPSGCFTHQVVSSISMNLQASLDISSISLFWNPKVINK